MGITSKVRIKMVLSGKEDPAVFSRRAWGMNRFTKKKFPLPKDPVKICFCPRVFWVCKDFLCGTVLDKFAKI